MNNVWLLSTNVNVYQLINKNLWEKSKLLQVMHTIDWILRRFAAVSPFCFGYPAQPDIASWRIRIIHNHFDRPTLFFATRRQGRYPRSLEAFFFTPVDFLSVSRHDARAPLERTKDVDFRRVQFSTEWCLKARNGSGGNVDDVDRSTSRRVGAWSIFWTSPELFSAVVSVIFPFLC